MRKLQKARQMDRLFDRRKRRIGENAQVHTAEVHCRAVHDRCLRNEETLLPDTEIFGNDHLHEGTEAFHQRFFVDSAQRDTARIRSDGIAHTVIEGDLPRIVAEGRRKRSAV